MTKEYTIWQGKSQYRDAGQDNPIGGKNSKEQAKESQTHLLQSLGVPQKIQANTDNINKQRTWCRLLQAPCLLLQSLCVYMSFAYWIQWAIFWCPPFFLTPTIFLHPRCFQSSEGNDPTETSKLESLHIMSDCGSPHPLTSSPGGILPDDDPTRHRSRGIAKYH